MKYVRANGIYFQDTGSGVLQIVGDRAVLDQLNSGRLKYSNQNTLKGTSLSFVEDFVDSTIESSIASGKTINPGLTAEDIAAVDVSNFMKEAEATIKNEYKGKFNAAKSALISGLENIDYDYAKNLAGIEREAKETRLAGQEDLAGRGLAFSSNRSQFETDLTDAESRLKEAEKETARRSAFTLGSTAEELLGTSEIKKLNLPSVAGRGLDSFVSGGSVMGSIPSEKQFMKESISRQLALDEANRRSYATRSLSFQ